MAEPQFVYEVWLAYLHPHGYRGGKNWENHYVAWMTEGQAKGVAGWIKLALRDRILNNGEITKIGYPSTAKQFLDKFEKDNNGLIGPKEWLP